jgi:hypothetical protein
MPDAYTVCQIYFVKLLMLMLAAGLKILTICFDQTYRLTDVPAIFFKFRTFHRRARRIIL